MVGFPCGRKYDHIPGSFEHTKEEKTDDEREMDVVDYQTSETV